MIEFHCPNCNVRITIGDKAAGRAGTCPKCHSRVVVPGAAASPTPAATDGPATPRKPCPNCGEMIAAAAKKCRFCGEQLTATPARIPCPSCGEMIPAGEKECRYCGEPLVRSLDHDHVRRDREDGHTGRRRAVAKSRPARRGADTGVIIAVVIVGAILLLIAVVFLTPVGIAMFGAHQQSIYKSAAEKIQLQLELGDDD